ncbi:GNAT family N-acetyltransferase [Peribacillus frigoritolerans]|uniref:GNAT family N-acetyltransferase n=1 Tax=Peribacillus frigoritolerans TaxID=450367 RepID=UPI001059346A|nr:GNAT family N-acetyltransferase [Peribacillus frigoritolerans]TDL75903.1 GNAT family N-acetyltransferase [Peribacillus frigoritolerans]
MNIRHLNRHDANLYRNIRLEGLKNNPEAFGSSYEEEQLYPIDLFKSRLESDTAFTFGAFKNNELAGVVTLVKETKVKLMHKASIFAMYVSPSYRGSGIGKKLMSEVVIKAQALEDTEQLQLSVVSTNQSAKELYTSFGFTVYGHEKRALKADGIYYDEDHMVLFL